MTINKEHFEITGLGGKKSLSGKISINGAKNAALKALAAALLIDGESTLTNVPDTEDIGKLIQIITNLGAKVSVQKTEYGLVVKIDPTNINSTEIDSDLAKTMRASVVLTGPMLARYKKLTFPMPGGCVIGARPIDLFIDGYKKMGAKAEESISSYKIEVEGSLRGTDIFFDKVSVGATETLMMAAVLANGTTVLKNCAMEPEIGNIAEWLNECGADIKGIGSPTLTIQGTNGKLLKPKTEYRAIPDRIEAGSYLVLGALLAKDLLIEKCNPWHLESTISILQSCGVQIETTDDSIRVTHNGASYRATNVRTHEYPGFATDLQAQMATFLTQCTGESTMLETIFEGRFKYVADLSKMGASITEMNPREILIKGPTPLKALSADEELEAHDIRAGFAIVMAALLAEGKSKINNIHLIDRGYEKLEDRLSILGANICRKK